MKEFNHIIERPRTLATPRRNHHAYLAITRS